MLTWVIIIFALNIQLSEITTNRVTKSPPILFSYQGSIYLHYKTWILEVTVEFAQYELFLEQLGVEIQRISEGLLKP